MTTPGETETESMMETGRMLKNVGRQLLKSLPSVDQLLELLDKLELVLSTIDQDPPTPLKASLVPPMKALIFDELLRHTDENVKISVISCITEITRITAPSAPYDDEKMKEIFKLTVAAFEKLSDVSGRCYEKSLSILDNVSKVRSCLVMLDLECDDLVIKMFQQFLKFLRSNHPHNVMLSMEAIMTLVLDESEEISVDLLKPLLDSVRKENQTISPISWTLGEKVITKCAAKLKPYLLKAVESTGRTLDEYAQIVNSICQNGSEFPQHDHSLGLKKTVVQVPAIENKLNECKEAEEPSCDVTRGREPDMTCVRVRDAQIMDSNTRSASASTMDHIMIKRTGSKRKLHSDLGKTSKISNAKTNSEIGNLESVREQKSESWVNTVPKKRGRKPNSLMNPEEGYDHSWVHMGRKTAKPGLSRKDHDRSTDISPSESRMAKLQLKHKVVCEAPVSPLKNEDIAKPVPSRKTHDIITEFPPSGNPDSSKDNLLSKPEDTTETLHSTDHSVPDGRRPKRGRPRKSIPGNQKIAPHSLSTLEEDNLNPLLEETYLEFPRPVLEKESEVREDSEVRPREPIRKIKFTLKIGDKTAVVSESVVAKMEYKVSSEDEKKPKPALNIEAENKEEGRSSAETEVKKRKQLNATRSKDFNESSLTKELITASGSKTLNIVDRTPKTRMRRRLTTASETQEYGNYLVGRRIKVWWPMDKMFYEGVIDLYDSVKGKHKILYADGDVEMLNLRKQRWELIAIDASTDEEQVTALQKLADASDIAERLKEKSKFESTKGANVKFGSRGKASASISKTEPVKSVDPCGLDRACLTDEFVAVEPGNGNGKDTARKPKTKIVKTGSDIQKGKAVIEDLKKAKVQVA